MSPARLISRIQVSPSWSTKKHYPKYPHHLPAGALTPASPRRQTAHNRHNHYPPAHRFSHSQVLIQTTASFLTCPYANPQCPRASLSYLASPSCSSTIRETYPSRARPLPKILISASPHTIWMMTLNSPSSSNCASALSQQRKVFRRKAPSARNRALGELQREIGRGVRKWERC